MNYFQKIEASIEKSGDTVSEFEYWGLVTDNELNELLTMEQLSRELNAGKQRPMSPSQCASFLKNCIRWSREVRKTKNKFDPDTTNLAGFFHFMTGIETYRSLSSEKHLNWILLFQYCIELALILQKRPDGDADEIRAAPSLDTPLISRKEIKHAWGNLQQFLSRYHKKLQKIDTVRFFRKAFPRHLFALFNDSKDISFPVLCVSPGKKKKSARGFVKNCTIWLNMKTGLPGKEESYQGLFPLNRHPESLIAQSKSIKSTFRTSIREAFAFSAKSLEKRTANQSLRAVFYQIEESMEGVDGDSIDSAVLMGALSRITGRQLPPYICFAGKIGASHNGIDSITARAVAGLEHGFKILVLPHENMDELREGLSADKIEHEVLEPERLGDYEGQRTICPYRSTADLFRIWQTLTQSGEETGTTGSRLKPGSNLTKRERNPDFTGRDDYLKWLQERFNSGASIAVLTGPGGVGKTQIALHYAGTSHQYKLVWHVRGEDRPTMDNSYLELARELNLPQKDFKAEKVVRAAVKQWLENNSGWLLIFDNVYSPDELLDPMVDFMPRGGGKIIITSRNVHWKEWGEQISIKPFKPAESVQYLLKRGGSTADRAVAAELSQVLGNLPLALVLASGFIRQTGISIPGYIKKFYAERQNIRIRNNTPPDYPYALATTLRITVEHIRKRQPYGVDLLNIVAFQSPNNIPLLLLLTGHLSEKSPDRRATADRPKISENTRKTIRRLGDAVKKGKPVRNDLNWVSFYTNENIRFEFQDVFETLKAYSLVSGEFNSMSVQRLLQQVARDNLPDDEEKQWCGLALNMMMHAFPVSLRRLEDRPKSVMLYPHAVAVVLHAQELDVQRNRNLSLIRRITNYLVDATGFDKAGEILELALEIACEIYDRSDFQVAWILRFMADCLKEQQYLEPADNRYDEVLGITKYSVEAREHDVARDLNNLGESALTLGRTNNGYKLFKEALLRLEQGESTRMDAWAKSYYLLARAYSIKGNFPKAKEVFEKALSIARKHFDVRHPFIADIYRSLGHMLLHWGKLYPAFEELESALKIDQAHYGPTHQIVALDKHLIGRLFLLDQNHEKAEKYLTEASQIDEKIYGALNFHQAVARDLNGLGMLDMERGRFDDAEQKFQQALRIVETIYYQNPEHLAIGDIEINYGAALLETDQLEEGKRHIFTARQIYEKIYGRSHPKVAAVLIQSGWAYHIEERFDEARDSFESAKEILEGTGDENHPHRWIVDQHIEELKKDTDVLYSSDDDLDGEDQEEDSLWFPP